MHMPGDSREADFKPQDTQLGRQYSETHRLRNKDRLSIMTGRHAGQRPIATALLFDDRFNRNRRLEAETGFFHRVHGIGHGGHTGFHIARPPAIKPAVPFNRVVGVPVPQLHRFRADHIQMPVKNYAPSAFGTGFPAGGHIIPTFIGPGHRSKSGVLRKFGRINQDSGRVK